MKEDLKKKLVMNDLIDIPGLTISAPNSGAGKTTFTLGLLRAFKKKGLRVQPYKNGPDYIDPTFHEFASGRKSFNLDTWGMNKEIIQKNISAAQNSDLIINEGSMGLYDGVSKNIQTNKIDIKKLNNLNLNRVNKKKFPLVNILKNLPDKSSLFETILVSANDEYVKQFLDNKIKFTDIYKNIFKLIKKKEFNKYRSISPKNINDIIKLNNYVRMKINSKGI